MNRRVWNFVTAFAMLLVTCGAMPDADAAQPMELPVELQAPIFGKLFKYDLRLKGAKEIRLVVVYLDAKAQASEIVGAFRSAGVDAISAPLSDLPTKIDSVDVVYFLESDLPSVTLCESKEKLSISGVRKVVETGGVSIALGKGKDSKPKLIVNLIRLQFEKHRLDSRLFKMVKVVKVELSPDSFN